MIINLRSFAVVSALAILAAPALASSESQRQFHYAVAPHSTVTVANRSGVVRIAAGQSGQVKVTATLHSDQVQVDAAQHGNRIELSTRALTNTTAEREQVDYLLEVPADGFLDVTDEDGRIEVSGLLGTSSLQGDSAGVSAENIKGGRLQIHTVSGPVELTNVRDADVDVVSVSGPVEMKDVCGNNVTVNTTNGRIDYTGDFAGGGSYSLANANADIVVTMPLGAAVDVSARSLRGTVENAGSYYTRPSHLTGSPDKGTSSVTLRSVSGTIRVTKQ